MTTQTRQPMLKIVKVNETAHPKLRRIATYAADAVRIAAEKAVANQADPASYPMPRDPGALEQIFARRLRKLTPRKREALAAQAMPSITAPRAKRAAAYGDLARVDLRSATPVLAQALSALPTRDIGLSRAEIDSILDGILDGPITRIPPGDLISPATIEMKISRIECVKKTRRFGELDFKDEIQLSGITVASDGTVGEASVIDAGKFGKGDSRQFSPPRTLASFKLGSDGFPQFFLVDMVLTELDAADTAAALHEIAAQIKDFVRQLVEEQNNLPPPDGSDPNQTDPNDVLDVIIMVASIVGGVLETLGTLLEDDVYPPEATQLLVLGPLDPTQSGAIGPQATETFAAFNGQYNVTYGWQVR